MKLNAAIVALAAVAGVCLPTHAQKKINKGQNGPAVVEAVKTIPVTGNSTTSPAAVFVVTAPWDGPDTLPGDGVCETAPGNGSCTFRAAVMEANAHAGPHLITFLSGIFDSPLTITLNGEVQIFGDLTIDGPGADKLSISGGNVNRVLWAMNGSTVTISDLTLADGRADGDVGGGLMIGDATVTLDRVLVKDSHAAYGGGICVDGGALTLTRSSVTGNSAVDWGAGLFLNLGSATITASTFSGNAAQNAGGAIFSGGTLSISDSTIANNTAVIDSGGGIHDVGMFTVRNTILAGNSSGVDVYSDFYPGGELISLGYNLVGMGYAGFNGPGDQWGAGDAPLDAKLGPLTTQGGTTPTHSLLAGSLAIDAGNSAEAADQRGMTRLVDQPGFANVSNGADIGAFEMQASTAAPVRVTGRVTNGIGRGLSGAMVYFTDMSGAARYARTNTFGYYIVTGLSAGDSYVVTVKTRTGLAFEPRLFTPNDSLDGLDFIAR